MGVRGTTTVVAWASKLGWLVGAKNGVTNFDDVSPLHTYRLATFETREDMEQAVKSLMGREVEGRPLFLREDRTAIEKEEGFVIFVSAPVC